MAGAARSSEPSLSMTEPGPPYFYDWNQGDLEDGLEAMGCKKPSVKALQPRKTSPTHL